MKDLYVLVKLEHNLSILNLDPGAVWTTIHSHSSS